MAGGGAQPGPITVVTTKRVHNTTGVLKTVKQAAADPNNEWGVDRIIVLRTETVSIPPAPGEIADMVRLDELVAIHMAVGMGGGGMTLPLG